MSDLDLATSYLADAVRQHLEALKNQKDVAFTTEYLQRAYNNFIKISMGVES